MRQVVSKLGELPWNLNSTQLNQCNLGELESLEEDFFL